MKYFDEQKESQLDGRSEQGAMDFKIFIIERYFQVLENKNDNKELLNRYIRMVKKFLKNETEDIGLNKYFLQLHQHSDKNPEKNYRILNELLIYLNENMKRIKEVWDINISDMPEKNKIRNSFELFHYYTNYYFIFSRKYSAIENDKANANLDYIITFKNLEKELVESAGKVIFFMKTIEKEKIDTNYKRYVLEKFLMFYLNIPRIKLSKLTNTTKEEVEILCQSLKFAIIHATLNNLIQGALKLFIEIINTIVIPKNQEILNYIRNEIVSNWKNYIDFEVFLKNKYNSEVKLNLVLKFIIKFYLKIFPKNNEISNNNNNNIYGISIFPQLANNIKNENFRIIKRVIEKLNDFEVNLENKVIIITLINHILEWIYTNEKKISYDFLYFVMNQVNNFFKMLFLLNIDDEYIGSFLREEKQILKDNIQKDISIKHFDSDAQSLVIKRYGINSIFYNLSKNKYDKYIFIKDIKYLLFEIIKPTQSPQNGILEIIKKVIYYFKLILKEKENSEDSQKKSILINQMADILSKFFFYYFYLYEKLKVNHQLHEQNEQNMILDLYISELTAENETWDFYISTFRKLMPIIFKLYKFGLKICPVRLCISSKLVHNIFKSVKKTRHKEKLFQIYFEYFSLKVYETGNPMEHYNPELNTASNINFVISESVNNITILKSIFFNLLECITDFNYFKNYIIPLIIDIIYLSKNSEYYGNYIYILRCFFKYLKSAINAFNSIQTTDESRRKEKADKKKLSDDFNIEINYILYAILKYLVNIKENAPFFNEMITEIIMIIPVKQRFLSEMPHLIFPSLVDNFLNGSDNIQLNLMNLESWMNIYIKSAESVVPFIQQNLSKITELLSSNLLRPVNINICLASLKWLSKLGGKGRNYFKEKRIISKTCPMQILSMKLEEKSEKRFMDFILDFIIDIDIDNCINWSSKTMHKKAATNSDKKMIYNYIEIYKNCIVAFFHKNIDYNFILEVKKNIINGVKNFNEQEFNSEYSFRQMNEKNSKVKINSIFRKKEHFIIGKIITGYFLINSSFIQLQNAQKDKYFLENDIMQFISYNFLMILLSKEKNNKNMLLFEHDPVLFLDEIIQFLFSSHPTIIKNTNIQLTEYSIKIINNIIDLINKFFDYDHNVIKNLEIVDIIYLKFLNCCYIDDSSKIDLGLMLIKILLEKFDKIINYKYLKYFFRSISSVTSNYSNIINIRFKKGCNNLVEVVDNLIKMFVINDMAYDLLTEEILDDESKIDNLMVDNDNKENKEIIKKARTNFIYLFDFLKYCFDDIVEKIDSENNYTRNLGVFYINKITGNIPRLKKLLPYLIQLDISNFNIKDFLRYFQSAKNKDISYQILSKKNNNFMEKEEYILPKIFKKMDNIFNTLTRILGLRETAFSNLITCSDALNNIFNISPYFIEQYIFSNNSNKVDLYLEVIKSLYINILLCYFSYYQISMYFKSITESFKSRLIYLFMEQLLVQKSLQHNFDIKSKNSDIIKKTLKNKVTMEDIPLIEEYIFENSIHRNEVNTRDFVIAEIFENLGLKINMEKNYIKLLDNLFSKFPNYFSVDNKNINEKILNDFVFYKKKTTELIFLQIFNLHTSSLIKECSKFLCNIFKNDKNLHDEILEKNKDKINNLINLINSENIKQSNCAINQDMISGLQMDNLNALLIICKSMKLKKEMTEDIIQKLSEFMKIPKDFKYENSQLILFYGYISLFLYIDVFYSKEFLYNIFDQLSNRFQEILIYPDKNLLNFSKTKYGKNVLKMISKYKGYFSKYVVERSNDKLRNKYIIELIKVIIIEERYTLICESIILEIIKEFKKNISILQEEEIYKYNYLIRAAHLLKICWKICSVLKLYLKSTSLLITVEPFMKNIMIYYDKNHEKLLNESIYQKIFKYWVELNSYYFEAFKDKKVGLTSLFFYKSLQYLPDKEKNKIDYFLSYQINLVFLKLTQENHNKNYKSIMNTFMSLDKDILKYFDYYVDILILPLMINYYKNQNFFSCYNITINNGIIDVEKKDNKIENDSVIKKIDFNKKNDSLSEIDENYLLEILEKLTFGLNKIKFNKDKKEDAKYKLLILLIILYKEYLSRKNINKDSNQKLKNIHYNIQALLAFSPFYDKKNQEGLWKIYLFFGICLFSDKKSFEEDENLNIIINFNKKIYDSDIQNIYYEYILSNCKNENAIEKFFTKYACENLINAINYFKIILKFPSILNNSKIAIMKIILNYIGYEIMPKVKYFSEYKKIWVQIIGLICSNIKKERENNNLTDAEKNKLMEIESTNFAIAYRIFKYFIQLPTNEADIFDVCKKLLFYFRDIINTQTKLSINFDLKAIENQNSKWIHSYVQLFRISFFYFRIDSLYLNKRNFDCYFKILKYMIDNNINHRIYNDYMFIFRLLTDTEVLYKLNNKERFQEIYLIDFKRTLMYQLKEIFKDKNTMKETFTNYEIKDLFVPNNKNNDSTETIIKKIIKYLIEKKLYPDGSNMQINNYQVVQQQYLNQVNQQQALNTTSVSTDATLNMQRNINNLNYLNPPQAINIQRQLQQPQISQDKWMETLHIYDIKLFMFYRKFHDDFYANIKNMIAIVNQNPNPIIEIKTDLENRLKAEKESIDLLHNYTYSFFENFYLFTMFFLREYMREYNMFLKKYYTYNNIMNKDIKDYFSSSHNYFYNLRNYEDLIKIRDEPIEIILNDKEKERDQNKAKSKYFFNILCIYPDIILSCFLFFFRCEEIMEKYYNYLIDLFIQTYRFFRDKYYDPLLEYLVEEIMFNKYLKNKPEEKNKFMFKFLKSIDQLVPYKIVRTNENIVNIFIKYLEYNIKEPYMNKRDDQNIMKSLRIILYNAAKFELINRKYIFELIKCYTGKTLLDSLKWIFNYDENEIEIYTFIYLETIPLSVDFLLSHFKDETPLIMNENNFSKFKSLNKHNYTENEMDIEESSDKLDEQYDKDGFIKNMVDSCNLITKKKLAKDLLDPIRSVIASESSSYYKLFIVIFSQIWKMLSPSEREILGVHINEFFYKYSGKQKDRNNMVINLLLETFSQCSPMIYIKPIIIQSLIPYQNFWSTNMLYLENLLINGIDIPSTYNSLINIFDSLKEDGLRNGLKYYFSESKFSKDVYSELQAGNYVNAESIFYDDCFNKLNTDILDKINVDIDNFNIDDNLELFNELSSWENGLIECYENSDNWNNIIELSKEMNNNDLKLRSLWYYGSEKWKELEENVKYIPDYFKREKNLETHNLKNSYIIQINDIYSIFKKLIDDNNNNDNNETNSRCQTTCMKCIQNIYQDFNSLHPKNLEIIDYYYFLIFQLAVESWESTNTLNDTIKKLKEKNNFNFKDNLLLWRERLPHYCEGYKSLRSVLEPRNYLFNSLRDLINKKNDTNAYMPHYTDKVWTDMIFMKYARKLNLIETFYKKKNIFEKENNNLLRIYPYEMYLKDLECIKLIRNNTFNYDQGVTLCNECINKFTSIKDDSSKDFVEYVINIFKTHKAYFYYKQGNIIEAHNLFFEASAYKNKESTDYHLYADWGEMCEEIAKLTINEKEECTDWFNNTIHNYIYNIVYKLDKAKFVIPKMIDFIKEFKDQSLKNKFNEELDEIPVWIWIFWLPTLFENLNYYYNNDEKNDFFFYILKKVAHKYQQMFYYPYKVYNLKEKNKDDLKLPIYQKYDELFNIISSENKYSHFIDKIEIIINELTKKEENNRENSLNSILSIVERNTFRMENLSNLKEFFKKVASYLIQFPDLTVFAKDIISLIDSSDFTRSQLREFVIKNKNYIHNLIVIENKYEKLSKLIEEKIYNTDFSNIEVPGYFSNKIIEPNEQNMLYISKFESEYSHKLITDARTKILIRCSNDKLMSFILANQVADKNIDRKIYIMQILFNYIFEKNYETYKRKVKFYVPIKFFISSKIKIVEEDINFKYNMAEIYEFCLQKRGYFPQIAYQIFEEEGIKNRVDPNFLYYSEINNEKLFNRMCKILPQDSFKNFIHKFILTSEDVLLFRKQFTISYAINNLLNFIILDNTILKNISFNKETGFCLFSTDLTMFTDNEEKELEEQKKITPLRLTKNINYFMNITSIYGIIPGIFNFSCKALLKKSSILKSIIKLCVDNNNNDYKRVDEIAENYMKKFKYVINVNEEQISNNNSMKNIYELIENSMSDDKLKKKPIDYEAWF